MNDKGFDMIFKIFPIVWGIMFVGMITFFVGAIIFNSIQYANRPDCTDGVLIQDDGGRFVCVPKENAAFFSRRGR